jgi:hypothetical protein
MEYSDKYLKYKNKYLNLKKMLAGGIHSKSNDKIIFIISSHHNRMVTMILDILQTMGESIPRYIGDELSPEINKSLPLNQQKFLLDNCTTLKIMKEGDKVIIKMLHPETPSKEDYKSKADINSLNLQIIIPEYPDNLIVYLVRHGEGKHNVFNIEKPPYNTYNEERIKDLLLDPELTSKGEEQSIECASKILIDIYELYNNSNIRIYFGCSHLKRTLQTVYLIRKKLINQSMLKCTIGDSIYVIPCIQEMIRPVMTQYQLDNTHGLVGLSLNPFESDISKYAPLYNKITVFPVDRMERVQHLIYENTPKCYMNDGIDNITHENCLSYITDWSHYINVHSNKILKQSDCADVSVLTAICNFYKFLF